MLKLDDGLKFKGCRNKLYEW